MRTIRFLMAGLILTSLAACGVGVDNDDSYNAQQRRDAKALQERFDRVRGTYEGVIESSSSRLNQSRAKLLLYTVSVTEGTNPDGSVKVRPALLGRFQLLDAVSDSDYLSLSGDYDDFGNLNLTSFKGQAGAAGEIAQLSLSGVAGGERVSLQVNRPGGAWGRFVGARVALEASAPAGGEEVEHRNRLLRLYREIEGVYFATVSNGVERYRVSITVTIGESQVQGSAITRPVLLGQYRRVDLPSGIGELQLAISYDSPTGAFSVTSIAGGQTTIPGANYLSGAGSWDNGKLKLSLRNSRGSLGEIESTRQPLR